MGPEQGNSTGGGEEPRTIRVLIVEENSIVREGLRSMLGGSRVEVVGEARTGCEAVEQVKVLAPDVILLGLCMPGLDVASVKALRCATEAAIVVFSENHEDLLALLHNSISYLSREINRGDLLAAVEAAAGGRSVLDCAAVTKALAAITRRQSAGTAREADLPRPLTAREREVLALVTRGRTNQEIAAALSLSIGTVKVHVGNILAKLQVTDRVQAAVWATQHGVGTPIPDLRL